MVCIALLTITACELKQAISAKISRHPEGGKEMTDETEETKQKWGASGLFIPAGLFIGMGVGWALGYLVQGLFVGLGVGLLGMAIARLKIN